MHVRSCLRLTAPFALAVLALSAILLYLDGPRASAQPLFTARSYPSVDCPSTLQDCINTSADGDSVNIQSGTFVTGVVLTKPVSLVGAGANATILSALASQRVIMVSGASITGSTIISGLTIANGNASGNGGGMLVTGGAQPLLANLVFTNNHSVFNGGGLRVDNASAITLSNVSFYSNTAGAGFSGGALHASVVSKVNLVGGIFQNNSVASGAGGAVTAFNQSNLIVSGTQFISNTSGAGNGGAIYAFGITSGLTLTNALLRGNLSSGDGGAVYAENQLAAASTQFISNSAKNGGGVYVAGSLAVTGTTFDKNVAGDDGGGAYAFGNTGVFRLSNALFSGNRSGRDGGAVYSEKYLTTNNTQFISNTAASDGGGVFARGSLTELLYSAVERNTANGANGMGGGIVVSNSLYTLLTTISSNTAAIGGGAYVTGSLSMEASNVLSNTAGQCGGANATGSVYLSNGTLFSGNIASQAVGGGACGNAVTLLGMTFRQNSAQTNGGGVFANSLNAPAPSQFISNSAQFDGAGAFVTNTLIISGGLFQNNQSSSGFGGGAYVGDTLVATNTQFISNSAAGSGGGAYANISASLFGTRFEKNQAAACGGLISLFLSATNTKFLSNTVNLGGGGSCTNANADIVNGRYENNRVTGATGVGGGATNFGTLNISNTVYLGNSASNGGGLYYANNQPQLGRIVNSLFARNQASAAGGAAEIALANSGATQILHSTFADPGVNPRAAIGTITGTLGVTDSIIVSHTFNISQSAGATYVDYFLTFASRVGFHGGSFQNGGHSSDQNPRFVDPASDNYHLSNGSPALNAGTGTGVASDFEGDPRPQGGGFELGYDEEPYPVSLALTSSSPTPLGNATNFTATFTNGSNFALAWDFGDGATSNDSFSRQSHTYASIGAYSATVSATNGITAFVRTTLVNVVPSFPLTVTKAGNGLGLVISSPGGIFCSTSCTSAFSAGAVVTLTAISSSGSKLAGWSGDCSGTGSCVVTMNAARSVTATFDVVYKVYLPLVVR